MYSCGSVRSRSDSKASCNPAAQPSVRWARNSMSAASTAGRPLAENSAAASWLVNRRSRWRISTMRSEHAPPSQRELRIDAAGCHDPHRRRKPVDEQPELLEQRHRPEHVDVVEDDDERWSGPRGGRRGGWRPPGRCPARPRACAAPPARGCRSPGRATPRSTARTAPARIITRVERHPCDRRTPRPRASDRPQPSCRTRARRPRG